MELAGRDAERAAVETLLVDAQEGRGRALVVRGEPGSGKSALAATAASSAATAMTVVHVDGVESEVQVGFAALHRLLLPFLGGIDDLPEPQRNALAAAFGRTPTAAPPPPMLVGLAALTLLTNAAETAPILCVIDDAHWVDDESLDVISFVARRLLADPVAMLLTARADERYDPQVAGLRSLLLRPLDSDASRHLLIDRTGTDVTVEVATSLASRTNGNPLALVELAGILSPVHLTGIDPLPDPLPVGRSVETKYLHDVRSLPESARTALLVAACEPSGRLDLIGAAGAELGTSLTSLEPAEMAGLITITDRVRFRHPLTRSAVYTAATAAARATAHRTLAGQLDDDRHDEERARHLAAATTAPDDSLADQLERCAERAGQLGRLRDQTDLLVRSASFTTDPDRRGLRLLSAARTSTVVGSFRRGSILVDEAVDLLQDPAAAAAAHWVQGLFNYESSRGTAPAQLLAAAYELVDHLPTLARPALVDAVTALTLVGSFGDVTRDDILQAAKDIRPTPDASTVDDMVLDSQVAWLGDGFKAAVPALRSIGPAWCAAELDTDEIARLGMLALLGTRELLDPAHVAKIIDHSLAATRQAGGYGSLQILLYIAVTEAINEGRFGLADALLAEAHDVNAILGRRLTPALLDIELWAWRGLDHQVLSTLPELRAEAKATSHGLVARTADAAEVTLALARGRPADALSPARRLAEDSFVGWTSRALPDLVEAAARTGDLDTASEATSQIEARAAALQTPWALGLAARARAMATDNPDEADDQYQASIEHLRHIPLDRARSELLYGEWLRRARRPSAARTPLRSSLETFDSIGAAAFATRARDELAATGETARRRDLNTSSDLTARESQVARLAADGMTNPEIAAALFISAATVEYHLSKVYRKLGLTSRRQLRHALPR